MCLNYGDTGMLALLSRCAVEGMEMYMTISWTWHTLFVLREKVMQKHTVHSINTSCFSFHGGFEET